MKVAIYCRVSSKEQVSKGVSLRDQKQRGIDFCNEKGYEYEIFEDAGISGSKNEEERPSLMELMKKTLSIKSSKGKVLEKPEFDGVYITDFDRLSRETNAYHRIKQHFYENKIVIFDKGQIIDLYDSTTSLLVDIKGSLASYELSQLKDRVKRSLERSVIEGKAGGGPVLNYGYCKGEDKKLIIDEYEAEVVRKIYDMSLKDFGTKRICNELNTLNIPTKRSQTSKGKLLIRGKIIEEFLWRDSTIYRILTNSIYCGERKFKGKIYSSPAIIDKTLFQLVQEKLKERKHFVNTTNKHSYLLKGLILCPLCKNLFYGRKRKDLKDNQYTCCSQRYSEYCGNRGVNIDKIDKIIWNSILELPKRMKSLILDKKELYVGDVNEEIKKSKKILTNLENKKNELVQLFVRNDLLYETLKSNIDNLGLEINERKKYLEEKERQLEMSNTHKGLIDSLRKQINSLKKQDIGFDEKQRIVRSFISFIIVKWSEKRQEHLIWTQFRISELSDLSIQGLSKISYDKSGFSFREKQVAYEYRVGTLKPVVSESEDGKRVFDFLEEPDDYFTIEDFTDKEYENFRELIWKARKRKGMVNHPELKNK
jgi:DNA invertase Pin-like site-specific DNA recombinase